MPRSAPRAVRALLVVLCPLLGFSAPAFGQVSHGGVPPGLDVELAPFLRSDVPFEVMPDVDVEALRAEDAERDLDPSIPWRFGADLSVQLDLSRHGRWEVLPGGDRVWRLGILSPFAISLSFAFERWVMPPGGAFFIRSADGAQVLGAFTEANNSEDALFATTLLYTDEVVLEYFEPKGAAGQGEIVLARVTHGYWDARAGTAAELNQSGACQNNVACALAAGWDDEVRSVAKYVTGGSLCTGALINNTSHDGTPYFLTADHCYDGAPGWWVFWFNYESATCSDPSWSPGYDSVSGASYRASSSASDFVLLELNAAPPDSYDVYYAGWSRSSSAASSVVGIHHPAGDIKKISVEASQIWASGNFWGVGPWDDGTTEGGSSGSPLFDQDGRIVGQLYGGSSACWGSGSNNGTDIYGRLDVSWSGGSSSSRLSDWLDPVGTGEIGIDGFDPNAPTAEYDGGVVIVSPAAGSISCATDVDLEVEITNHGAQLLTTATIEHRVDGGSWSTTNWSGSLSQGASATVFLGSVSASGGSHALEVVLASPADEVPGNDSVTGSFGFAEVVAAPQSDGFEGAAFPPTGWTMANADSATAWVRTTAAGGFGASGASAYFNNFDDDHRGEVDYVYLPYLDLTSVESPELVFDLAYARYNTELNDRLKVYVSDDCGGSWSTVYDKAGSALATAPDHGEAFVPSSSEWRTETVSLAAWASQESVLVAFGNVTGWGNDLFLDNLGVDAAGAGGDEDDEEDGPEVDDDDDDGGGVCGHGPNEGFAESEPNDWGGSGQYDAYGSDGGDLRITGTVSCAQDWSADVDWFVIELPCTGNAEVRLDWASGSDLDFWVYGSDRQLLVKNEDEDYHGPATAEFSGGDKLFIAVSCWWGPDMDYTLTLDWDGTSGSPATEEDASEEDDEASPGSPSPGEEVNSEPPSDEGPPAPAAAPPPPPPQASWAAASCAFASSAGGGVWGLALTGLLLIRRRGRPRR
jgi:hypothetical protein